MDLRFQHTDHAIISSIWSIVKSIFFLHMQIFLVLPLLLLLCLAFLVADLLDRIRRRWHHRGIQRAPDELNVLITGSTSGIGRALALEYVNSALTTGYPRHLNLILTGRRVKDMQQMSKELTNDSSSHHIRVITSDSLDVTDRDAMRVFIEQVHADLGHIDVVYCNAGVNKNQIITALEKQRKPCTREAIDRQMVDVNFMGVLNTIYPTLNVFDKDLSRDPTSWKQLAITSSMSINTNPMAQTYGACKSAVSDLCRSLRHEMSAMNKNIGVTSILPGWVDSNMSRAYDKSKPFIIPAEDAARRIIRGVHRNEEIVSFPQMLYVITRALQFVPHDMLSPLVRKILSDEAKGGFSSEDEGHAKKLR